MFRRDLVESVRVESVRSRGFARVQKIIRRVRKGLLGLIGDYSDFVSGWFEAEGVVKRLEELGGVSDRSVVTSALEKDEVWFKGSGNEFTRGSSEFLNQAFGLGTKKVYNRQGEKIGLSSDVSSFEVSQRSALQVGFLRNIKSRETKRLEKELFRRLDNGEDFGSFKDELAKDLKKGIRSQAERLARSEVILMSGKAQERVIKSAGLTKYFWVAALDNRTCEQCRALHRKSFEFGGLNSPMPVTSTHPNCRCAIVVDEKS